MALKACRAKDTEQMRIWTFYLCVAALVSCVWPVIEVVPYAVFSFLSLFIGDWYQEAHMIIAAIIVNPYKNILGMALKKLDESAEEIGKQARSKLDDVAAMAANLV